MSDICPPLCLMILGRDICPYLRREMFGGHIADIYPTYIRYISFFVADSGYIKNKSEGRDEIWTGILPELWNRIDIIETFLKTHPSTLLVSLFPCSSLMRALLQQTQANSICCPQAMDIKGEGEGEQEDDIYKGREKRERGTGHYYEQVACGHLL